MYCFFHDPSVAEQRAAARKAGGIARTRKVMPRVQLPDRRLTTAADVVEVLAETVNLVRRGEIDLRASTAIGYLSGIASSAQAAVELIKQEHFGDQEILFKDLREDLQQQTAALRNFVDVYGRLMTQNRRKLPPCVADFQENVSKQAVQTATQLVAQAKFKMLDDFGETAAADAVIKPYLFGTECEQSSMSTT